MKNDEIHKNLYCFEMINPNFNLTNHLIYIARNEQ